MLDEKGFSLLEVVVALSVLVILLTSANTLYLAGNQTMVLGAAKSELQQQARVALIKISQEIKKSRVVSTQVEPPKLILTYQEDQEDKTVRYRLNDAGQLIREIKIGQVFRGQTALSNFVQKVDFQQEGKYTSVNLTMAKDNISLQIQGGAFNRNHN